MKKFVYSMTVLPFVFLTACSDDDPQPGPDGPANPVQLAAPNLKVTAKTETTVTVEWEAVTDAVSYAYTVNGGEEGNIAVPSLALTDLVPSTEYSIAVKAVADDSGSYTDSDWVTVTATTSASASEPTGYTCYPLDPMYVMNELGVNLAMTYVRNLSSSGRYGVGYDDVFGDPTSFIWERESGEYKILDPGEYSACLAYDVNDSGIVVGSVIDASGSEVPAYLDYAGGGNWMLLPTNGLSGAAYPSFAAAINDEGLIGGQVFTAMEDGTKRCVPCYWRNYELDQSAFDVTAGEVSLIGAFIYGMSDDGRVLCGWSDDDFGNRFPTIWVNGVSKHLYENPQGEYVSDGIAWGVSPDGRYVTGYWSPDGMSLTGYLYDVTTDGKSELGSNGGVAVTNSGKVYAVGYSGVESFIYENGSETYLPDLFDRYEGMFATEVNPEVGTDGMLTCIYAVSADERVMAGSFTYSFLGGAAQFPSIVVFE